MAYRLEIQVMQGDAVRNDPGVHAGIGEQLARVKIHEFRGFGARLRRCLVRLEHVAAGFLKGGKVDLTGERGVPTVAAPLGDDAVDKVRAVIRKRGAQAAHKRLERAFRVQAVVAGPEKVKKLFRQDWPVPVEDQILQQNDALS